MYRKAYANVLEAQRGLEDYFRFYNDLRPRLGLGYQTPAEVFHGEQGVVEEESSRPRTNRKPLKLPPTLPSHSPRTVPLHLPYGRQSSCQWYTIPVPQWRNIPAH